MSSSPTLSQRQWLDRYAEYAISERTFGWSVRLFSVVRKLLGIQLHLHDPDDYAERGDIFLFNHFSRFETFIPQYMLYERTGVIARAVASAEFFEDSDTLGRYLAGVGAVPNNLVGLLPFLAVEVLKGRKLVVFPEGGMVKDRRVLDRRGQYGAYSRTAGERRKHHTGAAALSLVLDAFKLEVLHAERMGEHARLEEWARGLELESTDALVARAQRPTLIVPANITFYPLRVDGNILIRGAQLLNQGLSRRAIEELIVESNLVLRDTDMDIRLAEPVASSDYWGWIERKLMSRIAHKFTHLEDFFAFETHGGWEHRLLGSRLRESVLTIRNTYMERMYDAVTINLCHIASTLFVRLLDEDIMAIAKSRFSRLCYRALKALQLEAGVHLHYSISDPLSYRQLASGDDQTLQEFLAAITDMELIAVVDEEITLLPKLNEEHHFDEVRLENLVLVYANEAAPIDAVSAVIAKVLRDRAHHARDQAGRRADAQLEFDDELRLWRLRRAQYQSEPYAQLNARETATESGAPFLMVPQAAPATPHRTGVVLVHGFLASPAEMRPLAAWLHAQGLLVVGARLEGHGTSPWDLHERSWEDWLASVARSEAIAAGLVDRFVTIGFSTGGALALLQAQKPAHERVGVVAVNVPVRFADPRMMLVPWVARANAILGSVSTSDGILPFNPNTSEHPEVNYASIPTAALNQLLQVSDAVLEVPEPLPSPALLLQCDNDPVVDPAGFNDLCAAYAAADTSHALLTGARHGTIYDDDDGCWTQIQAFLRSCGVLSANQ